MMHDSTFRDEMRKAFHSDHVTKIETIFSETRVIGKLYNKKWNESYDVKATVTGLYLRDLGISVISVNIEHSINFEAGEENKLSQRFTWKEAKVEPLHKACRRCIEISDQKFEEMIKFFQPNLPAPPKPEAPAHPYRNSDVTLPN